MKKAYSRPRLIEYGTVNNLGNIFGNPVKSDANIDAKKQSQQSTQGSGSEVLTSGGIVGTIVSISGDMLIVRVKPDNVKLQVARSAVSSLVKSDAAGEEKKQIAPSR